MKILFSLLILLLGTTGLSQSLSEELSEDFAPSRNQEPFTEKVLIIGHSKKILILTNENNYLRKGDFISLLVDKDLAVRALVGKVQGNQAGIKILRIYSMDRYTKIRTGSKIQIIIGDDSFYRPKEEADDKDDLDGLGIKDQDDLFNDKVLSDINLEDKDNRFLSTDNLVHFSWGPFSGDAPLNQNPPNTTNSNAFLDGRGSQIYNDYSVGWARQVSENIFVEGIAELVTLSGFPSPDISSNVNSYALRLKYNYQLPLYMFVMPFIGYRISSISSGDAGVPNQGEAANTPVLNAEATAVNQFLNNGDSRSNREVIFGATLLRRFVPGWFLKSDLEFSQGGNFRINFGLAVEF